MAVSGSWWTRERAVRGLVKRNTQDKYGVSWQIVPTILGKLLSGNDAAKAGRVMQAMLKMGKLDIAGLRKAYEGA